MPKVEELYPSRASGSNDHIYNKKMERHAVHTPRKRVRCASETIILTHFVVASTFYRFKTLPSGVKCIFEMGSGVGGRTEFNADIILAPSAEVRRVSATG